MEGVRDDPSGCCRICFYCHLRSCDLLTSPYASMVAGNDSRYQSDFLQRYYFLKTSTRIF